MPTALSLSDDNETEESQVLTEPRLGGDVNAGFFFVGVGPRCTVSHTA